jgi:hypothetical protein
MRPFHKIFFAVILALISAGLSPPASGMNMNESLTSEKITAISFGKTGGFTNIPVEYRIDSAGNVFRIKSNDPVKINSVPRSVMRKLRRSLSRMDFEKVELQDPGNITYFITVISSRYRNTVKWNDNTENEKIKDLYKELMKSVKP